MNFSAFAHSLRHHLRGLARLAVALACVLASRSSAQITVYWRAAPGSGVWSIAANWASTLGGTSGGTVPNATTTTAVFGASTQTSLALPSSDTSVGGLTFNAGAPTFTFTVANNYHFMLYGSGVVNNSSNAPRFTVTDNSHLEFYGASSAGNSIITNTYYGYTYFYGNSTAGNSTINTGIYSVFQQNASAGTATLNVNGGSELEFFDNATAVNATINLTNGGQADISGITGSGVSFAVGRLTGNGSFYLGNKNLVLGSNNADTTFEGSFLDGDINYNGVQTGASLTKAGTGTLTLSGLSYYTGQTVISGGTLLLANPAALATTTLNYNNQGGVISFGSLTSATLGGLSGAQNLALTNAGNLPLALTVGAGDATTTYSGVFTGDGSLIKSGTGTLTLSNANLHTGGVTVTAGTLKLSGAGSFGKGSLTVLGGAFDLSGSIFSLDSLIINGGTVQNGTLPIGKFSAVSGTISAAITGGNFFKTGAGTLTLSGTNTYTGNTTLTGGALRLSGSGALPTGSTFVFNGGVVEVGAAGSVDFTSGTGTGLVQWLGDGGFSTYGGNRTVTFNGTGGLIWGAGGFAPNGAALILSSPTSNSTTTFSNALDLAGGTQTVQVNNGSLAVDAVLSGNLTNGALVKSGAGTLILSGTNTYAGGTRLTGGLVQFTALSNFGSGAVTLDGGGLRFGTGVTTDVSASLLYGSGGATFDTNANSVAFAAAVGGGAGGLTKLGTGTFTLNGANTYTGPTTVFAGTLVLSGNNSSTGNLTAASGVTVRATTNAGALGSGTLSLTTGTLQLVNDTSLAFGRPMTVFGDNTITLDRLTSGSGAALTFTMGDLVTLQDPASPFAPNLAIKKGSLVTTGTTPTLTLGNFTSTTGAFFALTNTQLNLGAIAVDSGTTTRPSVYVSNVGNATLAGPIAGNADFFLNLTGTTVVSGNVSGSTSLSFELGTQTLSGTNSHTGITDLIGGTLTVTNGSVFGSGHLALDGGSLQGNGTALTFSNPVDLVFSNSKIVGNSDLTFTGSTTNTSGGNLTLQVNNTGVTTFGDVALINTGATSRTVTFQTGTGANLIIGGVVANGGTSTAGNLSKSGAGTLTLSGLNTYGGATTVTAGILSVNTLANGGSPGGLGSAAATVGTLVINGGTLKYTGSGSTTNRLFTLGAGATAGTLDASGSGALNFNGTGSLATTGNGVRTLTLTGTNTDANTLTPVIINQSGNATSVTKSGSGTWVLAGTNTFAGKTSILAGTLGVYSLANLSANSALGAPTTVTNGTIDFGSTTAPGTLLFLGALSSTNRVLNLAGTTGGGTILASGTGAVTFSGGVTATGAGSKTLTLGGTSTADNTLSGATVDNSVSNLTSLSKIDGGTWVLSGSNTFSGGTTVAAGTLQLSGANALGASTGSLSVSGGTLDLGSASRTVGTATFSGGTVQNGSLTATSYAAQAGSVSANLGGSGVAFTKTGPGVLMLSGANTYSGGTILSSGRLQLAASNTLPTTGALTLSGGTLATAGFSQTLGTLTLLANSTIDFSSLGSVLSFASGSGQSWSGILTITNYSTATDSLIFGSSAAGLTPAQLSLVRFADYNNAIGSIDGAGLVTPNAIPEPGTYAAFAGIAALTWTILHRRRALPTASPQAMRDA